MELFWQLSIKSCSKSRESHWASIKEKMFNESSKVSRPLWPTHPSIWYFESVCAFVSQVKVQVEAVEVRRGFN